MKTNDSNISFKGGFYFKPVDKMAKQKISSLIQKNKRQVFYNLREKNDMFILTHDTDNYKVVDYIKSNKCDFVFYPQISTSNGVQSQENILDLIKNQTKSIIKNPNLIKSPLKNSMSLTKAINTVSKVLRLNIEKPVLKRNDDVLTTIRDNIKERDINVILTKGNTYYVEVKPDSLNIDRTCAIFSGRGRFPKICNNAEDRINFVKKFKSLQEEKANTLYQYKLGS